MDPNRFDTLTRAFTASPSRRSLVGIVAGLAVVGPLNALRGLNGVQAKKKHKKHKPHHAKPPAVNAFGCVDIGKACRGNDTLCCSGNCEGEKPQKGKQDSSHCVAHHTGDCTPATTYCTAGTLNSKCGAGVVASCLTTTGKADFCGNVENFIAMNRCDSCSKDAECEALTGPGSACVVLDGGPYCSGEHSCKAHGSNGSTCMPAGV